MERELFDWLARRGYRVTPRARIGAFRVDLLVEGANDARLAVECDGDRYEGSTRWADDVRRQRALEDRIRSQLSEMLRKSAADGTWDGQAFADAFGRDAMRVLQHGWRMIASRPAATADRRAVISC